jgi:serpin B
MFDRGFGHQVRERSAPLRSIRAAVLLAAAMAVAACSASATPAVIYVTPPPTVQATEAPGTPSPLVTPTVVPSDAASGTPTPWPSGQVVSYNLVKGSAKPVAEAGDNGAAAGTSIDAFAFDLFSHLDRNGNLCYSPASIALSLAMVRGGAKGATASEMDAVMHKFGAPGQEAEIMALLKQLAGKTYYVDADGVPLDPGTKPSAANPNPVAQLIVSDQVFSQQGMTLSPAFLDELSSAYNAGVGQLDFAANPESARLTINKWANDATKGRIPNVLQPGDVTPATRIALANAIYLKAQWSNKFDAKNTKPASFTTATGTKVTVPMMSEETEFIYGAGAGYRAGKVPLDPMTGLDMVLLVPDNMATFQPGLTAAKFASIMGGMKLYTVSFSLPKFSVNSRMDLAQVLATLGMKGVFNPSTADLSGITTDEKLFLQSVIHQANMDVDEEGVTAAAVTVSLGLGAGGPPPGHVDFRVDKPFLYFITDDRSGTILFMGRVDDPTAQ